MLRIGNGRHATRRSALAVGIIAVTLVGLVGVPTSDATEPTTFTWSGGSEVADGDARMSTPGNWAGGVAPAPGQQVDLVFPSMTCVANGSCGEVLVDVPDLVATSVSVTTPGRPPGPSYSMHGYAFRGTPTIRLAGPLRTANDPALGNTTPDVVWEVPIELDDSASLNLRNGLDLDGPLTGATAAVRTRLAGGLHVHGAMETDRVTVLGRGTSEVAGGSVNAAGGRTVFDGRALRVTDARFGPLVVRGAELSLMAGTRPTRVDGLLRLDNRTTLFQLDANAAHPLLSATGRVVLGGAELNGAVDCAGAERGVPFPVIRGHEVRGRLSDRRGRPLPDQAVVHYLAPEGCYEEPLVVRVGYTRRAVTLTILSVP